MKKLVEKIVRILKNDPIYSLDKDYSLREIITVVKLRFIQMIRGLIKSILIKNKGIFFCGKGVKIEFGYLIKAGYNLIIENNVIINALSKNGVILGNNVTIAKNSILQCTGIIANKGIGITIGNNSAVGAQSYLGGQGGIQIGNDVIMGPGVMIFSENHNYDDKEILIRKQGENRKGVKIGNNCWLGAGSTILDGVVIGEGCVIAAGSVVTKSFPKDSIIAGVPAKVIKSRCEV